MNTKQHLFYSLGVLAYAVAQADGVVQPAERKVLHKIIENESGVEIDFDYTEIIFSVLQKDKPGFDTIYEWAMKAFEIGKQHFTPELRTAFVNIITKVAEAFPPTTEEEQKLIDKFSNELWVIEPTKA